MACGCKAKKDVVYADPLTQKVSQAVLESSQSKSEIQTITAVHNNPIKIQDIKLLRSNKTYIQIRDQLDITSNTKPDQLCFNCIRKHLGMASMFSEYKDYYRNLTALGQLLCVVQHLKQTYPNLAYKVRDMIIITLRKFDVSEIHNLVKQLIIQFQKDPYKDINQYIPLPSFVQEQQLLTILLVQSLLFIQLTYQEVNKTWATAELSFMSYNAFRTQNSLRAYETYRPLWKLIQSMQPFDENYMAARDYIYSLIVSKYPYYQQIALPKMKDQLQRDYEKQKELMQKLQE